MNSQQQKSLDYLKTKIMERASSHGLSEAEYKRVEIQPLGIGNIFFVIIEAGLVGDEGTMAEVGARTRGHWFIGPRGGLSAYNKNNHKIRGWKAIYAGIY